MAGLVRVVVAVAYRPTLVFSDSWTYIRLAFGDEHLAADRPSGYPALLWLIALPGRSLLAVTTLQHLSGLALGVLVYWLLRRLDVARWAATAAAAVVVLDAYAIVLEQMILAEAFFSLALVLGAFLAIGRDRGASSIAVGGVLLAGATLMRTAGMFAIVVWLAYVAWRHRRVRVIAIATAAAIAPLGVYAAGNAVKKGNFGLTSADGWFLYGRVGEIADCSRFTPPRGTGRLCESAAQRANGTPLSYIWSGRSPANRFYGGPGTPGSSEPLRSFATAVIKARPAAYAGVVARDVLRYFRPGEGSAGRSDSAITLPAKPDQRTAPVNRDVRDAFFPGYAPRAHAPADLARAYAAVVHPPRPLLGLLVAATLVLLGHAAFARRRRRAQLQRWPEALLLTGMGMAMLIGTAASSAFVVRYLIPAVPLLVAGGTVALADLARAYRSGRSTALT